MAEDRHLQGLLGTAGKHIAALPGAKEVIARMRTADSAGDLRFFLQSLDLGLEEPAQRQIVEAAGDEAQWREVHAKLLMAAEQQFTERFSSSS